MALTVYLDESMVDRWVENDDSPEATRSKVGKRLLVGAVITSDGQALESVLEREAGWLLADPHVWNSRPERPDKRDRRELFEREHFHFTHDSPNIRQVGLGRMLEHEVRAHVTYSHLQLLHVLSAQDIQTAMYFTMVRTLLQRYAGTHLEFVFENETDEMHRRYGKLVAQAAHSLDKASRLKQRQPRATADARVAYKPNGGLSTVDYCLGVVNHGLQALHRDGRTGGPQPFEMEPVGRLNNHIAHVANFDDALHRRRFDILAPPSRARHIVGASSHSSVERPFSTLIARDPTGPFKHVAGEQALAAALGMSHEALVRVTTLAGQRSSYRFVTARIRGKWRHFTVPTQAVLINAQRRIVDLLLPLNDALHESCTAYVRGRSALNAASPHCGNRWIQTLDIKDFFPSTTTSRVHETLAGLGATAEVAAMLANLTTYGNALPTGARTSPLLSNLVLADFDYLMADLARSRGVEYTRYADDLTFSGSSQVNVEPEVVEALAAVGYRLNEEKSRTRRRGQALRVAGLTIFEEDAPRVPKRTKRRLRLELFLLEKSLIAAQSTESPDPWEGGGAGEEERDDLRDRLAATRGLYMYCQSVERGFARRLLERFPNCKAAMIFHVTPEQRGKGVRRIIEQILATETPTLDQSSQTVAGPPPLDGVSPVSPQRQPPW